MGYLRVLVKAEVGVKKKTGETKVIKKDGTN